MVGRDGAGVGRVVRSPESDGILAGVATFCLNVGTVPLKVGGQRYEHAKGFRRGTCREKRARHMQERKQSQTVWAGLTLKITTSDRDLKRWAFRFQQRSRNDAPPRGWKTFLRDGWSMGIDEWRARYRWYLQSRAWGQRREGAIRRAESRCDQCHHVHERLDVHHTNYIRVGDERVEDLRVLCRNCHRVAHTNGKIAPVQMNTAQALAVKAKRLRRESRVLRDAALAVAANPSAPIAGVRRRPGGVKVADA